MTAVSHYWSATAADGEPLTIGGQEVLKTDLTHNDTIVYIAPVSHSNFAKNKVAVNSGGTIFMGKGQFVPDDAPMAFK